MFGFIEFDDALSGVSTTITKHVLFTLPFTTLLLQTKSCRCRKLIGSILFDKTTRKMVRTVEGRGGEAEREEGRGG